VARHQDALRLLDQGSPPECSLQVVVLGEALEGDVDRALQLEPGYNLHTPSETCSDPFVASRSPTGMYRTAPLKGMFAKSKRGFGADGALPTLLAVVNHYDSCFKLGLSSGQKADLVQFLRSR
jgi:hypothetical protein